MTGLAERILQARKRPSGFTFPAALWNAAFITPAPATMEPEAVPADAEPEAPWMVSENDEHTPTFLADDPSVALDVAASALDALPPAALEPQLEAQTQPAPTPARRKPIKRKKTIIRIPTVKPMPTSHAPRRNGTIRHANGNGHAIVTLVADKVGLDAPEKALDWLAYLARKTQVSAVPLLLDYYRRLGWVPSESYGWLCELSTGITKQSQPATWKLVRTDAPELAVVHRESYRRCKQLFGAPGNMPGR